ncbi:MAG: hypothetical protein ACXV8Q_00495 [Methylobacter sp.]
MSINRKTILRAELKVDCYDGEKCDQHKKYWETYADGDMSSDTSSEPLVLDITQFPPGTKIQVSIPLCPKCTVDVEMCECGYDWKQWAEEMYA